MTTSKSVRQKASLDDSWYLGLQAQGWAWEWLRRAQDYKLDFESRPSAVRTLARAEPELVVIEAPFEPPPERWHLRLLEDPDYNYSHGAVFWDPRIDSSVLPVTASSLKPGINQHEAIDLRQFDLAVRVLKTQPSEEHVLISDGHRSIHLHVLEGSILDGPVRLAHVMNGIANPLNQFLTIERLTALRTLGRLPVELFPADPRASRWILALKAYDMSREGISLREIADRLYANAILTTAAGTKSDWPKSRVRRLLNMADTFLNGGYSTILSDT
jgi:hypothetical protein